MMNKAISIFEVRSKLYDLGQLAKERKRSGAIGAYNVICEGISKECKYNRFSSVRLLVEGILENDIEQAGPEALKILQNVWRNGESFDRKEVFGERGYRTMGTLTKPFEMRSGRMWQQFRIWDDIPNYLAPNHSDSAGKGMLFHISGAPGRLDAVIAAWFPKEEYAPFAAPNGTQLYLKWTDRGVPW
jgi:hypothetical protein